MLEMYNDYTKYSDDCIFSSCRGGFKNIKLVEQTKPTLGIRNKKLGKYNMKNFNMRKIEWQS